MTIEIYTHEKDSSSDNLEIIETNRVFETEQSYCNSGKEFNWIWSKHSCKCLGVPPSTEDLNPCKIIFCRFNNHENKSESFVLARGWVIVKDKGNEVARRSNFVNE